MHENRNTEALPVRYAAFDQLPMPVAIADKGWRILYHNAAFRQLLGVRERAFDVLALHEVFESIDYDQILFTLQTHPAHISRTVAREVHRSLDLHITPLDASLNLIDGYMISCVDRHPMQHNSDQELAEHHRQFLSFTNIAVIIHRKGHIVYANMQANRLVGYSEKESIVGRGIWEFVPEAFRTIIRDRIQSMVQTHQPSVPLEEQFVHRNGSIIDVEVFAFPIVYDGEAALKTFITDITAKKQAQRQLHESRQRYFSLVENVTDIIFQTDDQGNFIFLNSAWNLITGYTVEETLGHSCFQYLHHPQNTELFQQKIRKLLSFGAKEFQYDLLLTIKDQAPRYVEANIKPLYYENGTIMGINGILRDIHSRKVADMEVRKIHKTLKSHQLVLSALTKEESLIRGDFSAAIAHIAKVAAHTISINRVNIWRFTDQLDVLHCLSNYNAALDQYEQLYAFNFHQFPKYFNILLNDRVIISDHAADDIRLEEFQEIYIKPERIVSMMDMSIMNGDQVWGVICFEADVYHRWTLEDQSFARSIADFIMLAFKSHMLQVTQQALLEKDTQYRKLVEQARDAIVILDEENRFVEVNDATCKLTGYSRDELMKMHIAELVPKQYKKHYAGKILNQGSMQYYFGERIFIRKDGTEGIAEISAQLLSNGMFQGIVRDITERKAQEKALRESESRLELALKGADLGTWDFYIPENRMVHNRRWAEMLGYQFENTEVTEEYWERFIHPDDKERTYKLFEEHLAGKRPYYEAEIRMLTSDGQWKWILDKGKVVEWDKNGNPLRASGIQQDITHIKSYQQQLLRQKLFLQELIDTIPNMIYVRSRDGNFQMANSSFTSCLGFDPVTKTNHPFVEKFTTFNTITKTDNDVLAGGVSVMSDPEEVWHAQTGKKIFLQTIKVPVPDLHGQLSELLSVSVDVSEIKIKEAEVKLLNDQLERKVLERTVALEQANKELETFNYSVSHDLRTPLRSIDVFAYLLDKHYAPALNADGLEHIHQIRKSVIKMSRLIDNLLILSKMGRNDRKNINIPLIDLVSDIIDEMRRQQDIHKYTFTMEGLQEVWGDKDMLRQALANLLGNAVKYSSGKTKPHIQIFSYLDAGMCIMGIRDNGVGFSSELGGKLFKAFKRLHSDDEFEGSGIGLAIVDRIVRRHGGSAWAESVEGKGSCFYISLPVAPEK